MKGDVKVSVTMWTKLWWFHGPDTKRVPDVITVVDNFQLLFAFNVALFVLKIGYINIAGHRLSD